ncbi:hypothetical protein [Phytomonospora endophytica]|uniref:SWIM-type domain-containing protein n=1 Tax=Phytomonospora endophytica TaxID=714109 RepID=A0A841FUI4_9ACTN|nr:hypothetical protein [Phytomonospora endophytica]MBB6037212.1 hypothetical protein [Phytomonospora endophytica]GIG71287.1 hypothetical protein Pen01_75820 [Phytomonospora endophytica]
MRPTVDAALRAALTEAGPARVRGKLDADPAMAEAWTWTPDGPSWTIATGTQLVRLDGEAITEAGQVSCDCLLTPRCLHLLAVLAVLSAGDDVVGAPEPEAVALEPEPEPEPDLTAPVRLTPRQREAADLAWRAGAALLADGAARAGTPVLDALRHVAETARKAKLPLLSTAATRVSTGLAALSSDSPAFRLPTLTADLQLLLSVASRLRGEPNGADVGAARRDYTDHGGGRFLGICAERISTGSGYAGVVTYLVDADRRIWTVADVRPGGPERVQGAYTGTATSLPSPHELCRSGAFATGLRMSADGRLGRAESAEVARVAHTPWSDPGLDPLWTEPLAEQLDRIVPVLSADPAERRAGDDLVFADVTVGELRPGALTVYSGDLPISVLAAADTRPAVGNLRRLAGHGGQRVRMVLRAHPSVPRAAFPIAVGECEELRLPKGWAGRANLTLDELPGALAHPIGSAPESGPDPLDPVARLVSRTVLSGRAALRSSALPATLATLRRHRLPTAAGLIDRLAAAANATVVRSTGESAPAAPDALASAWIACGTYEVAARQALMRRLWTVTG